MKKQTNCRLCKSDDMFTFLDLGYHPHSDQFRKTNDEPETRYPLTVQRCRECGLVQLGQVVDAHELYQKDYLYEASITATADKHWGELADDVISVSGITSGKSIDIGGNDGTLALKFKERGFEAWNVDPCKEVCEISESRGVNTICDFWGNLFLWREADIITGTNVFAHVDDLDNFMQAVCDHLSDNGIFVFESPYLLDFLEGMEYDTVYHQHLSYLSLKPLIRFVKKFGMEVFRVQRTALHGGGFRVYMSKQGTRPISPDIDAIIAEEEKLTDQDFIEWGHQCKLHRDRAFEFVYDLYKQGKTIACVSSPAKGMTFLNYTGIAPFVSFVTEKSKLKQGRYTPGTKILIENDEKLITEQPDYAIILAWNFRDEIINNNPDYRGVWLTFFPTIEARSETSI